MHSHGVVIGPRVDASAISDACRARRKAIYKLYALAPSALVWRKSCDDELGRVLPSRTDVCPELDVRGWEINFAIAGSMGADDGALSLADMSRPSNSEHGALLGRWR